MKILNYPLIPFVFLLQCTLKIEAFQLKDKVICLAIYFDFALPV